MRKAYEPKVARPKLRPELVRPLAEFLHSEANSGLVLVGCAALALVWANSPWAASYFALWGSEFTIGLGATHYFLPISSTSFSTSAGWSFGVTFE